MIAQLKADISPDIDANNYYLICAVIFGIILMILIIATFRVCCCKDYDPMSDFERRRKRQAKQKLKDAKKNKKLAGKNGAKRKESDSKLVQP